jgi:hypothetical protein
MCANENQRTMKATLLLYLAAWAWIPGLAQNPTNTNKYLQDLREDCLDAKSDSFLGRVSASTQKGDTNYRWDTSETEYTAQTHNRVQVTEYKPNTRSWLNVGSVISDHESKLLNQTHHTHTTQSSHENLCPRDGIELCEHQKYRQQKISHPTYVTNRSYVYKPAKQITFLPKLITTQPILLKNSFILSR